MKRVILLFVCLALLVGCGSDNKNTGETVEHESTEEMGNGSTTSDVAETDDITHSDIDIRDEEGLSQFIEQVFLGTLDYDAQGLPLNFTYGDINSDGNEEAIVTISEYDAVFIGVDANGYILLGSTKLGKTLDDIKIEDGFVIFDVGYSGTGTSSDVELIFRYDGKKMTKVCVVPMGGHEAGYGEIYEANKSQGYKSFELTYVTKNDEDQSIISSVVSQYIFDESMMAYSIEEIDTDTASDGGQIIALEDINLGDTFSGFTFTTLDYSDEYAHFTLEGSKIVNGQLMTYYDEMYESYDYYLLLDEPLLDVDFSKMFKYSEDDSGFLYDTSFSNRNEMVLDMNDFLTDKMMEDVKNGKNVRVTVNVTELVSSVIYGSEGYAEGIRISDLVLEGQSFDASDDGIIDIDEVFVGQEFGRMKVSNVTFDGDELVLELEGEEVVLGRMSYFADEINSGFVLESDELEGITDINVQYELNSGFEGTIGNTTTSVSSQDVYNCFPQEIIDYMIAGNSLLVSVIISGYEVYILDMSEGGGAVWAISGGKVFEDITFSTGLSDFENEAITTTSQGDVYIDYSEHNLVIIPELETINADKLTPIPVELGTTGFHRVAIFGELSDVEVTIYTSIDVVGDSISIGDVNNSYLAILADLPNDMSHVKVSGTVPGSGEVIEIFLDDMREPSEHTVIMK